VLTVDPRSAAIVGRIFAEYLDGSGDQVIANGLNRDGVLCPYARRPDQNCHPVGRRLAGRHGSVHLGKPALHRLRPVRPLSPFAGGSAVRDDVALAGGDLLERAKPVPAGQGFRAATAGCGRPGRPGPAR
jgi:hypothetical protein